MWDGRLYFVGSRVTRHAPSGALVSTHELPVSNVTSLCFGDEQLDRLFVTSAGTGLTESALRDEPLAGGLFELDPGTRGIAPYAYAG